LFEELLKEEQLRKQLFEELLKEEQLRKQLFEEQQKGDDKLVASRQSSLTTA
jgi:hypothetical protein